MKRFSILIGGLLLLASCSKSNKEEINTEKEETMYLKESEHVDPSVVEETNWDEVSVTSPIVNYEEITSDEIEVRGTTDISLYIVDEKILFDFDEATIRDSGKEKLEEVVKSVEKRFPEGELAVRGFTDAIGTEPYNKELSQERAKAVAEYIREHSEIGKDEITVLAKGEQNPVATNETARGRQMNRRAEILVRH
jgi:outer membrane protein OmpA-like peptidoglycan-associated protein